MSLVEYLNRRIAGGDGSEQDYWESLAEGVMHLILFMDANTPEEAWEAIIGDAHPVTVTPTGLVRCDERRRKR